jgi:hypothetical protein
MTAEIIPFPVHVRLSAVIVEKIAVGWVVKTPDGRAVIYPIRRDALADAQAVADRFGVGLQVRLP